jgi:hypothetical protein
VSRRKQSGGKAACNLDAEASQKAAEVFERLRLPTVTRVDLSERPGSNH